MLPQWFNSWSANLVDPSNAHHRYWSLVFDAQPGGGSFDGFHYFGGIQISNFSVYQGIS
jgi:hypothetical protein